MLEIEKNMHIISLQKKHVYNNEKLQKYSPHKSMRNLQ